VPLQRPSEAAAQVAAIIHDLITDDEGKVLALRVAGAVAMALISLVIFLTLAFRAPRDPVARWSLGSLAGLLAAGAWLVWPRRERPLDPSIDAQISARRMAVALHVARADTDVKVSRPSDRACETPIVGSLTLDQAEPRSEGTTRPARRDAIMQRMITRGLVEPKPGGGYGLTRLGLTRLATLLNRVEARAEPNQRCIPS
jgi:hypothetical protein